MKKFFLIVCLSFLVKGFFGMNTAINQLISPELRKDIKYSDYDDRKKPPYNTSGRTNQNKDQLGIGACNLVNKYVDKHPSVALNYVSNLGYVVQTKDEFERSNKHVAELVQTQKEMQSRLELETQELKKLKKQHEYALTEKNSFSQALTLKEKNFEELEQAKKSLEDNLEILRKDYNKQHEEIEQLTKDLSNEQEKRLNKNLTLDLQKALEDAENRIKVNQQTIQRLENQIQDLTLKILDKDNQINQIGSNLESLGAQHEALQGQLSQTEQELNQKIEKKEETILRLRNKIEKLKKDIHQTDKLNNLLKDQLTPEIIDIVEKIAENRYKLGFAREKYNSLSQQITALTPGSDDDKIQEKEKQLGLLRSQISDLEGYIDGKKEELRQTPGMLAQELQALKNNYPTISGRNVEQKDIRDMLEAIDGYDTELKNQKNRNNDDKVRKDFYKEKSLFYRNLAIGITAASIIGGLGFAGRHLIGNGLLGLYKLMPSISLPSAKNFKPSFGWLSNIKNWFALRIALERARFGF